MPPPDGLQAALRRIFRPLVRLLIARAIPFPVASGLLRGTYVEVAAAEFQVAGKRQTDSRITLLTGVHRKDVKRLRAEREPVVKPSRSLALGTQLVGRWMSVPPYLDAGGQPKPLPRVAGKKGASFEALVRSVNTDIRPRVVLDEWLRLGLVHVDDQDRIVLNVQGFVPAQNSEEMAYFFGRNVHDHVAAAAHNLLGDGAPFLERSMQCGRLSAESVAELDALARTRGVELLRELNARALELQERDAGKPDATRRVNVGIYAFNDDGEKRDA
jgi:hypothetical protein